MGADEPSAVIDRIGAESFWEWYREREFARNIREGKPYFNGPSPVPEAERHSPSNLMQCHRKIYYRQENAPEEQNPPEGIFWSGRRFEEDIIVPYLQDVVAGEDTYVRNSMWVDTTVEVNGTEVRFKGATDPAIVTAESEPLVVTEVKTKSSLDGKTEPNRHHRAQVHAYMHGLSESYDRPVKEAVIIYGDRKTLNIKAFHEPFDQEFWNNAVDWAAKHTEFRQHDQLPPPDPEYGWECEFCSFRHRCGESEQPYQDTGATGFLPGFSEYPQERITEYLASRDDDETKLTPTLAQEHPDLADEYAIYNWYCSKCDCHYPWDAVDLEKIDSSQPLCPSCAGDDTLATLREPSPANQRPTQGN